MNAHPPHSDSNNSASVVKSVAIVEDNHALGVNMQAIVNHTAGFTTCGLWGSGEEALKKVPAFGPDIVLMDIHLPGISGIETTALLKSQMPQLQVIMVTVYLDHDKIFSALKAGACGYILKRAAATELPRALVDLQLGGAPMSPEIARRVVEAFHTPLAVPKPATVAMHLTKRETEILELLATGLANKEIADRLNVSIETVRVHLKRIYEKLHVHSRTEAAIKYRDAIRL